MYNLERPHEACDLKPPVSRYSPSTRPYPERLPVVEYDAGVLVRRVRQLGTFTFHGRQWRMGEAFANQSIGLLPTAVDGVWTVSFSRFPIGSIDEQAVPPSGYGAVDRLVTRTDDTATRNAQLRARRERQRQHTGAGYGASRKQRPL